ncbi:MAG: OmpA family protein [Proteobacteria bacterium]|nr:MAG: OmpA family protein [Pseudomonadota bacterium]
MILLRPLKPLMLSSVVLFSSIPIFAFDNEVKIPFSNKSSELSSEASLNQLIDAHKTDEKIGFLISDGSVALKQGSLSFILEKNRTLKIYQSLLKMGIKPSRIAISTANNSFKDSVLVQAKEGVNTAIAALPASSSDASGETSFKILFDSASAVPKFSSKDELAKFLSSFGQGDHDAVVLEGHTDSVGNAAYNKALAELRALSVFQLLVENGLPPYRVDTKAVAQSSAPGKGRASADDRAVIVRWTKNKEIAAAAAAVEEPKEEKAPVVEAPPPAAPVAAAAPQPVKTEIHEEPRKAHSSLDLVVAAGALIPGGELSDHAKVGSSWGLGIGKSFWSNQNQEVRGTLFYHGNSNLKAKESTLNGPLHISSYTARVDYVFGGNSVRPFIGLGAGAFKWDGSIVQNSSQLRNVGGKSDGAGLAALGLDIYLSDYFILAPEATFYNVGGHFSDKLYAGELTLRWRL